MGTDCPDIDGATIVHALKMLNANDLVIGPAEDGGYYLLGLKHPTPELFKDIDWGTDKVLAQTEAKAKQHNLNIACLHTLNDIDTPADLESIKGTFLLP